MVQRGSAKCEAAVMTMQRGLGNVCPTDRLQVAPAGSVYAADSEVIGRGQCGTTKVAQKEAT